MTDARKSMLFMLLIEEFVITAQTEGLRTKEQREDVVSALTMVGLDPAEIFSQPLIIGLQTVAREFGKLEFTLDDLKKEWEEDFEEVREDEQNSAVIK